MKISPDRWPFSVSVKTLKYLVYSSCTLCNEKGNTSEKTSLYLNLSVILTKDTFSTHFCLGTCNWGTMKSLEIKIALFCELFQNRFYFKDTRRKLRSWSVRKFRNFLFHCFINMKNNYHQTFPAVCLMTYIHVKLALFIYNLCRLYKKHVKNNVFSILNKYVIIYSIAPTS